jgi:hypothetical protein
VFLSFYEYTFDHVLCLLYDEWHRLDNFPAGILRTGLRKSGKVKWKFITVALKHQKIK